MISLAFETTRIPIIWPFSMTEEVVIGIVTLVAKFKTPTLVDAVTIWEIYTPGKGVTMVGFFFF